MNKKADSRLLSFFDTSVIYGPFLNKTYVQAHVDKAYTTWAYCVIRDFVDIKLKFDFVAVPRQFTMGRMTCKILIAIIIF